MKLIPIDYQNLPREEVLAYNGVDIPQIGILLRDDETTVFCATDKGEMANVTHYLPLDQIKPESDKPTLLELLPEKCITQKRGSRIYVYANERGFNDNICVGMQLMTESIKDFEKRIIDELT